jgi:hypothetical protein
VDGVLYLVEKNIGLDQAIALKEFLIKTKDNESKLVHSLIIDNCQMKDDVFATILEGIIAQAKMIPVSLKEKAGKPPPPRERPLVNLKKICYTNN